MPLTDADLVARVLVDDDHHAFAELVRNHQSAIRGLLRQLTRSDLALADDLAQETFLRAYKHIRSFRGEAKFSTWLYRIAYNCFREEARKRKELVGIDETVLEAQADPQTVDPALKHDLMHALQLLPLHERSAIVLCCQNGLSHEEAARRAGDSARHGENECVARPREVEETVDGLGTCLTMDEQLQEDWLDARLRDEAPYIDDAGFTAQVMQKLPARRAARLSFRGTIMLCITLLASALTYVVSGGGRFVESRCRFPGGDPGADYRAAVLDDRHHRGPVRDVGYARRRRRGARAHSPDSLGSGFIERSLRVSYIARDLFPQRGQVLKFLLRPQITQKTHFDLSAVDVAVEIEEMQLEQPRRRIRLATVGRTPRLMTPRSFFPSSCASAA